MRVLGAVQPAVSIRACRSEQVETVEDVLAVLQYLPAQPFAHEEEGQPHGQQLDAERQGLFLQLGDGLDEAEHDAHHRGHDDGRQGKDHDQIQGLDGIIDGKFHVTGVVLHAPAIAAVLLRDEVLSLRRSLGEETYQYALQRGRYQLGGVRRFFQWRDTDLPLAERCALHGTMALLLIAGLWPEDVALRVRDRLPALPATAVLPSLTEEECHELWRGVKKLLLKEVAPSWAPCFD